MSIENVQSDTAIAVSVITGFLGSGKTTLLNYLLQHPDIDETAVLINEFGEIGLDHLLVEELDDEILLLASGSKFRILRSGIQASGSKSQDPRFKFHVSGPMSWNLVCAF